MPRGCRGHALTCATLTRRATRGTGHRREMAALPAPGGQLPVLRRIRASRGTTGRRAQERLTAGRPLADCPSRRGSALVLGRAAPDAVDLPCPQRERQASAPNPAGRADRFGLRRLLQGRPGSRDRKEQIGVGRPAGGSRPTLSAGDQPRRPGLAGLLPVFSGFAHQSASSTSAAARPTAVHIIQFIPPGRGSEVGAASCRIAVSYGLPEASGVRGPGRHILSTALTGDRTI